MAAARRALESVREHDPDRPDEDFKRTHYNSMTFQFELADEAREFHERFG